MIVVSFFDGMSCGQIALKELDINIDKYYSSELDKFAINQTIFNFPDTIQLGDVLFVRKGYCWKQSIYDKAIQSEYISDKSKQLLINSRKLRNEKIDLFIGGSPCQGFSFAGKQLNFNDPRSKLFFEFVKMWNEIKKLNTNAKFLLENVNMKKTYVKIIIDHMGLFPCRINSNLVSAQNRDRLYWTNIRTCEVGLFGEIHSDIPQPDDKGILLKDILQPESEVDQKYYIKNPKINFEGMDIKGKSKTLRTGGKGTQSNKHGKTNCLTSVQKDNLILLGGLKDGKYISGKTKDFSQGARVYSDKGKSSTINSGGGGQGGKTGLYEIDYKLRRLTPLECSRLQTVPEWYKFKQSENKPTSDSQIYKILGNGWTIEVIKHIFKYMF